MIDYLLRAAYIAGVRGPRLAYLSLGGLLLTFSTAPTAEPVANALPIECALVGELPILQSIILSE